jgi:8-oxo-dGTP diphosphatase
MASFAGVLAVHQGQVALVHERYAMWDREYWNQPGGAVEEDESPLEAAVRELAEETGLVVAADALVPISTMVVTDLSGEVRSQAWNFTVDVEATELQHDDPNVREARWFNVEEAVDLLTELPYPPIAEPAVAFLRGIAPPGSSWRFMLTSPPGEPPAFSWSGPGS